MNEGSNKKPVVSLRLLRNILVILITLAAEAGLTYLGYTFYMTSFLQLSFRIILIAAVAMFMLGLIWLVRRYIINN